MHEAAPFGFISNSQWEIVTVSSACRGLKIRIPVYVRAGLSQNEGHCVGAANLTAQFNLVPVAESQIGKPRLTW